MERPDPIFSCMERPDPIFSWITGKTYQADFLLLWVVGLAGDAFIDEAHNHCGITQMLCLWRVNMQYHRVMIRHHRIGRNVDTKGFG